MRHYTTRKKSMFLLLMVFFLFACTSCSNGQPHAKQVKLPEEEDGLTIWAWDEAFNITAAKAAKEIYEREHPDSVIRVVTVAQDDIVAKLNTAFASGVFDELPDIVLIEDYRIPWYLHHYSEKFANLSDIADADDFAPYKTEMNQMGGDMYGIPFDCGVAALFYRTDYIEQAGYSRKDMENLTWDKYIEIGKAVKEKTGKYMLSLNPGDLGQIRMMLQSAGSWYTDENGRQNIVGNGVLREAILTYKKMVDAGIAVHIADWNQFVGAFNSGEVASVPTGCWVSPSLQKAADQAGKWAVAEIPRMKGVKASVNASSLGGGGWYVLKDAGHEEEAKNFLKETFASNVELMDRLVEEIHLVSTLKAASKTQNYREGVAFFGGQKIFEDFAEWVEEVPTVNYGEDTYEIETRMEEAFQKIMDGVDMDVVLEGTFAAAETADKGVGAQ